MIRDESVQQMPDAIASGLNERIHKMKLMNDLKEGIRQRVQRIIKLSPSSMNHISKNIVEDANTRESNVSKNKLNIENVRDAVQRSISKIDTAYNRHLAREIAKIQRQTKIARENFEKMKNLPEEKYTPLDENQEKAQKLE